MDGAVFAVPSLLATVASFVIRRKEHLLPQSYIDLNARVYLHDSNLRELSIHLAEGSIDIMFEASMIEGGPCQVRLHYTSVSSFRSLSDPDKSLPGPGGYGDFGYDELEVLEPGLFEHRILFSSGIEFVIVFAVLSFTVVAQDLNGA